jgi:hypothetical protein
MFNHYAACGILQNKRAESIYPGHAATNAGADVRSETLRIEAANFGDGSESGVIGLTVETQAGSASEKHAKRGTVAYSPYHYMDIGNDLAKLQGEERLRRL